MQNMTDNGRGGSGWRYQCRTCGHAVGIDTAFPEKCPGCQAAGWWGKLTVKPRPDSAGGMSNHTAELCPPITDADMGQSAQNRGKGRRGARPRKLPQDLIEKWAGEGCGSMVIAQKLEGQGVIVSYRTILRRLQTI